MNWHEDPWRRDVAAHNEHQPQPGNQSFAFADPFFGAYGHGQVAAASSFQPTGSSVLFPPVPGQSIAGLWPPMRSFERFPGASVPTVQPSMNRPELGPSLLPASEAQTLTQLFGMVAQQHQQAHEESGQESFPEMQPHQRALSSQLNVSNPESRDIHRYAFGVVGQTDRTDGAAPNEMPVMFNQVHQLRLSRQQSETGAHHDNIRPAVRPQVPSIFMSEQADEGLDAPMQSNVEPPVHQVPTRYEGDEDTCSICQLRFADQDMVCRLPCRHVFHQTCIDEMIARDGEAACPNCRGASTVVATWRYIAPVAGEPNEPPVTEEQPPIATPAQSPRSQVSAAFHTPQAEIVEHVERPSFPWWPVPEASKADETGSFHVNTHRTESGQLGLLVDPGSYGNLVGEQWIQDVTRVAGENGYQTSKSTRAPLEVGGVGKGTQRCTQEITVPAALRNADGCMTKASFSAPMIPSSPCPAL